IASDFTDWVSTSSSIPVTKTGYVTSFRWNGRQHYGLTVPFRFQPAGLQPTEIIITQNLQSGGRITLRRRRARTLDSFELAEQGWELALPRLRVVNPYGREGKTEVMGISGQLDSSVPIRHYE